MAGFTDNEDYWIERHINFKGDIRSVGNIGNDIETNLKGYEAKKRRIKQAVQQVVGQDLAGKSVLELGCGIGMLASTFVDLGASYTGIDISQDAVDEAQRRCPAGTFIASSIIDLSLSEKFDVVFCSDVLVHIIEDQNWIGILKQMSELCKDDGNIIIIERILNQPRNILSHMVSRPLDEYQEALKPIGRELTPIKLANDHVDCIFEMVRLGGRNS